MAISEYLAFEPATEAFNEHDLDRLEELLADDVAFEIPGRPRSEGKAACLDCYRRWFADFPDAHVEVHDLTVSDVVAIEHGTFTGTHGGPARTGRSVVLDYVQVIRFRAGKQVSLKLIFDRLRMLEQLGLMPCLEDAT
jgi:steroid delta-isomerase-like uncharacterized protein